MDRANYNWQKHVVGYSGASQRSIMRDWFNNDSIQMMASVMVSSAVSLFVIFFLYNNVPWSRLFQTKTFYEVFCDKFEKQGIARRVGEGPFEYSERLVEKYPHQGDLIRSITDKFIEIQFQGKEPPDKMKDLQREMKLQVKKIKF